MKKFVYYSKNGLLKMMPRHYFKWNYLRLKKIENQIDINEINDRVDYYFRKNTNFNLPKNINNIRNFKNNNSSAYYYDMMEYLYYFDPEIKISYQFGDGLIKDDIPTFIKVRSLKKLENNSIIFKLNKIRHFNFINDKIDFKDKMNKLVWRGGAYRNIRKNFVKKFWNKKLFNVGQTNVPIESVKWQKSKLTISQQLKYKFIFCPEGNDVATNLKWVLSSNSLCFMPKPKYESWFMEGRLKPNIHYIEIKDNFEDLEEKIIYYTKKTKEALDIIKNANQHVNKFKNSDCEDIISIKIIEKYLKLSNQNL